MRVRDLAVAAAMAGAGYAVERAVVGRRTRLAPADLAAFAEPAGTRHLHIPTDDGGELHVAERGDGRPLVFLHGITLSALAWHYQLVDLADRFRVLTVDHRGHGRSRPGSDSWSIGRLARDVDQLLEALDLDGCVLVGHSMGGMATLQFAADFAEQRRKRVAGLVLMSTSHKPLHRLAGWRAATKAIAPSARRGLAAAGRVPGGLFPSSDLSHVLFRLGMGESPSAAHIEINRRMTSETPVSVWSELMTEVVTFDVRDRMASIDTPALVVVGSRDLLTPPDVARRLAHRLPDARLEVVEGAGHMPMLERRERVNALLAEFAA